MPSSGKKEGTSGEAEALNFRLMGTDTARQKWVFLELPHLFHQRLFGEGYLASLYIWKTQYFNVKKANLKNCSWINLRVLILETIHDTIE